MNDPFGSMTEFINQFHNFVQSPAQFLAQRRLPQNAMKNPAEAVQQLLNSGQMTQAQLNQLQRIAKQIQTSPAFGQMFK